MTAARPARAFQESEPGALEAPIHLQSTGRDGFERLHAAWSKPRRFSFLTEINNTHIGVLYVATGFLFFLGAGVLALLMRIQLAAPSSAFLDPRTYNQFFTMHGTVMMFLFAVPIVEAIAETDDWAPLADKLARIEVMGAAYSPRSDSPG